MPAEIVPLRPTFDPARVELTSPGTQRGLPFYVVDIVEGNGGRACMWAGTDHIEATIAAIDCAEGGLAVVDLTGPAARRDRHGDGPLIDPQAQRPAHPIPIHRALRRRSTGVLVPVTAAAAVLAVLAASWLDPIGRARPRLCAAVLGPCGPLAPISRGVA